MRGVFVKFSQPTGKGISDEFHATILSASGRIGHPDTLLPPLAFAQKRFENQTEVINDESRSIFDRSRLRPLNNGSVLLFA